MRRARQILTLWAMLWLAIVSVGVGVGVAVADTGGSMGGGSWSGGGGGGYSGDGGSYSYSSDSSSSGDGRPLELFDKILLVGTGVAILGVLVQDARRRDKRGGSAADRVKVDVSVLRIAVDGRARKFVQTELARIAKKADTRTTAGRHAMLREVTLLLRRVRSAWVYGGAVNEPMRKMSAAKAVFDRHVLDARAQFLTETIRNADGVVTTRDADEAIPRAHEGEGLVLVSIIVAARSELFTVRDIGTGEDLRKALESAAFRSADDLVAIEIVWQPSKDSDRLSSIELEAKYPPPALRPIEGAMVGKTFCAYCGGLHPAELVSCPHCGARSEGRPPSRTA